MPCWMCPAPCSDMEIKWRQFPHQHILMEGFFTINSKTKTRLQDWGYNRLHFKKQQIWPAAVKVSSWMVRLWLQLDKAKITSPLETNTEPWGVSRFTWVTSLPGRWNRKSNAETSVQLSPFLHCPNYHSLCLLHRSSQLLVAVGWHAAVLQWMNA